MNNQFGDWEEYLKAIEAHTDVRVIGVTDYLTLEGYSRLKSEKASGRIPSVELLIPNIEFRFAPPTDKATPVNIHLLVCPDNADHEKLINEALTRLSWTYNRRPYSCTRAQLIDLGKAFDPSISDEVKALTKGVEQFKIDFTAFRSWYEDEHWLKTNSLVVVSAGDDGLSGFLKQGGWAAHREEITRFSHMLFSGRPGEREFWLAQGAGEDADTVKKLGGPKPCIHGSDAHSIEKLFKPDQDRQCWVKANPTFEGLRQLLYEPADRIHIGPTPPIYHDEARIIKSIGLSKANGWFEEREIALNSGLVSIIGQKGSGKSALAEMSAYTAGSWDTDEPTSFLNRAGANLNDLTVSLNWLDGRTTKARLGDAQPANREVRYLSQKFVERLCSDDHIGGELVREIEDVVFTHIDPTETLNASNFQELRSERTHAIRTEAQRLASEVRDLIREECRLRDSQSRLPEKRKRVTTLTEEKVGLLKQMPKPATEEEAKLQVELQGKRAALVAIQQKIASEKQRLQKVADIRARVQQFTVTAGRFSADLAALLSEAGIPAEEHAAFKATFSGDTDSPLLKRTTELKASVAALEGGNDNPAEHTMRWLEAQIKALVAKESVDKARQSRIQSIQMRIALIEAELMRLDAEIKQIEGPEKLRIAAAYEERSAAYVGYFANLTAEHKTLQELYGPVKKHLGSESASATEKELEFAIQWEADLEQWLARGVALFDQRRTLPYGTFAELGKAAKNILVPAWTSGDPATIKPAVEMFVAEFKKQSHRDYLRGDTTVEQFLTWLYDVAHISLRYGLKYNGVDLEKLSPGTKGIVLLILYLGMDTRDSRPLIVDQPDENLDNESIFQLLTAYFRAAKTRRQIILITHNPNLVVNADSEQVVVAHCSRQPNGLPHITYVSGALEDDRPPQAGIKQQVCRILEGGTDAFRRRERRYDLLH
ncbi:MAG: hypothetical protein WC815_17325 [Vicinamibacterales bacterium]|jgi:energy-coupling factor transporter ATP-binding protein EcfA2